MVWNAYKGLGRAMNVPYSLNMTCCKMEMLSRLRAVRHANPKSITVADGVNPKLAFEQNCVAEGPFLFDISASAPPSLRLMLR